jgi:hypothetical protein
MTSVQRDGGLNGRRPFFAGGSGLDSDTSKHDAGGKDALFLCAHKYPAPKEGPPLISACLQTLNHPRLPIQLPKEGDALAALALVDVGHERFNTRVAELRAPSPTSSVLIPQSFRSSRSPLDTPSEFRACGFLRRLRSIARR